MAEDPPPPTCRCNVHDNGIALINVEGNEAKHRRKSLRLAEPIARQAEGAVRLGSLLAEDGCRNRLCTATKDH